MLHKSFKSTKCKTALKLAASRIKLLKNKREAQVKQLKRELAQLLEAGQDRTARIRVEHLVREEKTMAAYDLIEIYCELVVARLSIIESQKACPIDLKEAISSLIFASPRCSDVPELMDVRKLFTAKYGKEFVSAAVELRPDCGVSRLLVEKLSAKAPDGPAKMKILSAIAEEHNVKWEPESFEENVMKPPEDLLSGPNTFEQASKMHVEFPNIQQAPNSINKGPDLHVPSGHYEKHDITTSSYGPNSSSSPHSHNFPSSDTDINKTMPSGTSNTDSRPLGAGPEKMDFRHPYGQEGSGFSLGRQNWNMEFEDATAAAQAAAESAERASMAARAAAELSSKGRIHRQHSTESRVSSAFGSRDEGLPDSSGPELRGEHLDADPVGNTINKLKLKSHYEQSDANQQDDDLAGLTERLYNLKYHNNGAQSASSNYNNDSMGDYMSSIEELKTADRHSQKSSLDFDESSALRKTGIKRESSESEAEIVQKVQDGVKSENVRFDEEERISKQSSGVSSLSHSQNLRDDHIVDPNFNSQSKLEEAFENPFIIDGGKLPSDTKETGSCNKATAIFDDSASEDENEFHLERQWKSPEPGFDPSEGRNSSSHLFANAHAWSPVQAMDESSGTHGSQTVFDSEWHPGGVFLESLTSNEVPSQPGDLLPTNFDDSDGPGSDGKEELDESKLLGSPSSHIPHPNESFYSRNAESTQDKSPGSMGSPPAEKEDVGLNRMTHLEESSLSLGVTGLQTKRNQGFEVADRKFSHVDLHSSQPSPRLAKSQSRTKDLPDSLQPSRLSSVKDHVPGQLLSTLNSNDTENATNSSVGSGIELNYGTLTGGRRNKGYRHPTYHRNPSDNAVLSEQTLEDTSVRIEQFASPLKVDIISVNGNQESYNQTVHQTQDESTDSSTGFHYAVDESDEELPRRTSTSSLLKPGKAGVGRKEKASTRTYFDSDSSDSEEDIPRQTRADKNRSGVGFSLRTKPSPLISARSYYSNSSVSSSSAVTTGNVEGRKMSNISNADETHPKLQSPTKSSAYTLRSGQHRSAEGAASKSVQLKSSSHEESYSRSFYAADAQQISPSRPKRSEHNAVGRKMSNISYANETHLKTKSPTKTSVYPGRSGEHKSEEQAPSKPIQSKGSSHEESTLMSSHTVVAPKMPPFQAKSLEFCGTEQPRSAEPAIYRPIAESQGLPHDKSQKSAITKQPSNPPVRVASGSAKNLNSSSSFGEPPSSQNASTKASHVHPKLPDYDSFAAHLLSLRQNQK
uniref:Uncharacterized protein n=2 Tax=Rhizophora mucronata TaxID=61149 RepID=A0A2P2KGX0_RHIMU